MKNLISKFKAFYGTTYGMLIVISWVVFLICLIIKLLGGNWFELSTDNTRFIAFCNFVDNTQWLKMILACCIYLITTLPVLLILLNEPKLKPRNCAIFIPLMICKSVVSWYSVVISYILDFVIIILLPLILKRFKNWKIVIFGNILVFVFQCITLLTRNIGVKMGFNINNTFLVQMIFQIDYYLMILLFYLYYFKNKNKENK